MNQNGFAPILILVGILIIAAVTGGAYFLGTRKPVTVTPSPTPTVTSQTPQPTPTNASPIPNGTGETANWKPYTNTKYGYSLKYPTDKFVQLVCPKDEKENFYLVQKDSSTQNQEIINMPSCARDSGYLLEIRVFTDKLGEPVSNEFVTVSAENITVGGIEGKKYTFVKTDTPSPASDWYVNIILIHNERNYKIDFGKKSLEETFNQILSTFRFEP